MKKNTKNKKKNVVIEYFDTALKLYYSDLIK